MFNKNNYFFIILIITIAILTNSLSFASSYDSNGNIEIHGYEKVKMKSIEDYYNYINMVGAVKSHDNIGPDSNINNQQNSSTTNNNSNAGNSFKHFSTINQAIARDMDNNETQGELVSDGYNTKFSYTDKNCKEQYIKGWVALSLATGQKGWYHFDNEGNMSTGFFTDKNGDTYYLIDNGINKGMMATGQLDIDGKIYVFCDEIGSSYGKLINQ